MKKLLSVVLGTLVLASSGVFAADNHNCKTGTHWDAKKMVCIKDVKK